ncbi:radical SAM/SPASM domain-containing protein [Thermodesulfobacteriota bacterium]
MQKKKTISDELVSKCTAKNIPFSVTFELTYYCNLRCKHCYAVNQHRQELALETIIDLIDQLKNLGAFYLSFTGGEIFTRPDIFDILSYGKQKGFFQVLLTNGTLITREMIPDLQKMRLQGVEISLLGATAETHEAITGVTGSFEKALNAIRMLHEAGIFVYSKTTLMRENVHEYIRIKELARELGAYPRISSDIVPRFNGDTGPQQNRITWEDRLEHLKSDILDEALISFVDEDGQSTLTCKAGRSLAGITPYGDVVPCTVFPVPVGNIYENSFKQIWYNPDNALLSELRSLGEDDIEKCSCCEHKAICGRCVAAAYFEHKNLRAPSSQACENAQWTVHVARQSRLSAKG